MKYQSNPLACECSACRLEYLLLVVKSAGESRIAFQNRHPEVTLEQRREMAEYFLTDPPNEGEEMDDYIERIFRVWQAKRN